MVWNKKDDAEVGGTVSTKDEGIDEVDSQKDEMKPKCLSKSRRASLEPRTGQ